MKTRALGVVAVATVVSLFIAIPAVAAVTPRSAPGAGVGHHRVCGAVSAGFARCHSVVVDGGPTAPSAFAPTGLDPSTIKNVYGFPATSTAGAGKTIAIVDAYDAPTIESDLATFSTQYGLPACTTANGCFKKVNQTGGTRYPRSDSGWALEISLDVQWVHAIAPGAKILLVEASSNSFKSLLAAEDYAAANASYVTNSWGGSESSGEMANDSHFVRAGVSFFASSGDSGLPAEYPSASPNVISVGGTTLTLNNGVLVSETGWSGGGGGCSAYENATAAQSGFGQYAQVNCGGKRATPDVALVADPASGVSVYDSTAYQGSTGWFTVGGTSASSPMWAARSAVSGSIVDAGAVYGNSISFRDVTSGNNGASCLVGYDLCSGRGSWTGTAGPTLQATTTALTPSANPSMVGQSVTFTATVSPTSSPIPTGTVQFRDGAANLGSPQTLNGSSQAAFTTSSLGQGSHAISAVYSGDGAHTSSASSTLTQQVNAAVSTVVSVPSNGGTVSGNTTLAATAWGPVAKVEFIVSGGPPNYSNVSLGNATGTIYGWLLTWTTTNVPDGTYTLKSRAYDASNLFAESPPINVNVDNIAVSIAAPSNGSSVQGTTTVVAAPWGAFTHIDFLLSGGAFNKALVCHAIGTIYGWLCDWNTTTAPTGITAGTYTLIARAANDTGAYDDSAPVTVTVAVSGASTTTTTTTSTTTTTTTTLPPAPGPAPTGAYAPTVLLSGANLDFPDPYVFRASNGTWYAYSTGTAFYTTQVASSTDLVNWTWVGDPFGNGGSNWANMFAHTWAPAVIERPGNAASQRFVMYYTSRSDALNTQCVGRATSSSAAGPFFDEMTSPMLCQTSEVWSLDASPYIASDGTPYLVWASGDPTHTARIWSRRMNADGLGFAPGSSPTNIITYSAGAWEDPVVEAPAMMPDPAGGLFLFYAGNSWDTANYAEGVAHCSTPTGPCTRSYTTAVVAARSTMVGPGSGTPFQDGSGNWELAFQGWESPYVGYDDFGLGKRSLRILPITFPNGLPKVG